MIADIVAATTEFIPSSSSGMNLRNLEMAKIEEVMNVDESLNFDIRTPPDVEIPQDITEALFLGALLV